MALYIMDAEQLLIGTATYDTSPLSSDIESTTCRYFLFSGTTTETLSDDITIIVYGQHC